MAANGRKIVSVEYTREKANEFAAYCRPAGNERGQDRHPRIYQRTVRAENLTVNVYVVVADAVPSCPTRSLAGLACVKAEGHKGRCVSENGVFWGEGRPEAKVDA